MEDKVLLIEVKITSEDDESSLFDLLEDNDFEYKVLDGE